MNEPVNFSHCVLCEYKTNNKVSHAEVTVGKIPAAEVPISILISICPVYNVGRTQVLHTVSKGQALLKQFLVDTPIYN